jgi:alkylation response protein AidB-like acyl-CoA dehydrogenase
MSEQHQTTETQALRGGQFIFSASNQTFIPEEFTEEQLMIRDSVREFANANVYPNIKAIEKQTDNISAKLLETAGELGFLGANIPEEYGGLALDTNTNSVLTEEIGATMSFSVSVAAHTGIGILPIFYFGTQEQKAKYLPALSSGQMKAAYCLTEPGSGSDALAARSRAELSADGKSFVINGQKMWITNSAFADIFIVFAKIDGDKFTGFIVERGTAGLSFGAEEDKLGIKGSSTRQVFFENVTIPKENVLGEVGKGHLIAFNVLNVGRFKLGFMALGASKRNASMAIKYANERQQFKQAIANFGAIQHKIADQAIQIYSLESASYRASMLMQEKVQALQAEGKPAHLAYLEAAEEYAIECAMLKVLGSDTYFNVANHTVQVHGGNGFSEEYGAARDYRDNRINLIFEGTNEINRILMMSMVLRRLPKDANAMASLLSPFVATFAKPKMAATWQASVLQSAKATFNALLAEALQAQAKGTFSLKDEQEFSMALSDIMIGAFALESMMLRLQKLAEMGQNTDLQQQILDTYAYEVAQRLQSQATEAILSVADANRAAQLLDQLSQHSIASIWAAHQAGSNPKANRRNIAAALAAKNMYSL